MKINKILTSWLAAIFVSPVFIRLARDANQIHLSVEEIYYIASMIRRKVPCRFLVFGFGNDSYFWNKLNRGGETIFLEDDPTWFAKVNEQYSHYASFLVHYGTRRTQWQELLGAPEKLMMNLPEEIKMEKFDCILVDGPQGWVDTNPGRMKSIFEASRLIKLNGDIFVHDCDREVEQAYCNRFLGHGVLKKELARLRHYCFP
jgi:uncharacterized protein (TIGR01627 family)